VPACAGSPGWYDRVFTGMSPNARDSPFKVPENEVAKFWVDSAKQAAAAAAAAAARGRGSTSASTGAAGGMTYRGWESASAALRRRRIKLGVVSSDFGVHPVATLVRGLIQLIDRRKVRALPPP
jgi:predicted O-linked N-acetylglucosamine transferase (SPINDLY family)